MRTPVCAAAIAFFVITSSPEPAGVIAQTRDFDVPRRGSVSFRSAPELDFTVGYARVQAREGIALPNGLAIFGYLHDGALVSEVAVSTAPLDSWGRIYAEVAGPVNTGITIANPNSQAVIIDFYFTDARGGDFGHGSTTIEATGQIAAFLNEAPFNAEGGVHGTFTFSSSLPVSAMALRGFTNERSEFLMSTLPVARVSHWKDVLTIPQFVDSGGWRTSVVLVNTTDVTIAGELRPFASNGDPLPLKLNGVTDSVFSYSIPPRSSRTFRGAGTQLDVRVGSIRISTSAADSRPSAFARLEYTSQGIRISETSIPAIGSEPINRNSAWTMFVESFGDFGASAPGSIQSGIAIANLRDVSTSDSFRFELSNSDGTSLGHTDFFSIRPFGQMAMFLGEIPGLPPIPDSFQGTLRVFAGGSRFSPTRIAVTGLRGRYNERGDFVFTTTTPINEPSRQTSSELLFPHLAVGRGYQMQFVLFSDRNSAGMVHFFDRDGAPLSLSLQ